MLRKLITFTLPLLMMATLSQATEITYSKTFVDGEVLTASDLETMKTDITTVVNAGGGPAGLTNAQTISGNKTLSGTTSITGDVTVGAASDWTFTDGNTFTGPTNISGWTIQTLNAMVFEGNTADANETTFAITDPTADRTITFPNDDLNLVEQAVQGWVIFNTSDDTIDDHFNVDTLTNIATGETRINWDTDFSSANYAAISDVVTSADDRATHLKSQLAASVNVVSFNTGSSVLVDNIVSVIAIGDQ